MERRRREDSVRMGGCRLAGGISRHSPGDSRRRGAFRSEAAPPSGPIHIGEGADVDPAARCAPDSARSAAAPSSRPARSSRIASFSTTRSSRGTPSTRMRSCSRRDSRTRRRSSAIAAAGSTGSLQARRPHKRRRAAPERRRAGDFDSDVEIAGPSRATVSARRKIVCG